MIANTGTYDTAHSVHLTRDARRLGVHGFLAVTPYYNKPPAEGLARHFAAIAAAADGLPVIIYNIPQRVILNLEPALIARLARESANVVAVKQATTDLEQAARSSTPGSCSTPATTTCSRPSSSWAARAASASPRTSSARDMLRMCELAEAGDFEGVRALDRELSPVYEALLDHDQSHPAQGGARAHRAPRWARRGFRWSRRPKSNVPCCAPPLRREA